MFLSKTVLRGGEAAEGRESMLWFEIPPGAFILFATQRNEQLISHKTSESPEHKACVLFTQLLLAWQGQSHISWDRSWAGNQHLALLNTPRHETATGCQAFLLLLFPFFKVITINQKFTCNLPHLAAKFTHLMLSSALNLSHLVMPEIPLL